MVSLKQTSEGLRWTAISSTAYEDRDKEIVSTKALRQAVQRNKSKKEYGPLRFWHTPGIELGTTDFQMLSDDGKYLIESGIVHKQYTKPMISAFKKDKWQISIGFAHPPDEPDQDGIFNNIQIFERSIVPQGFAANGQTTINLEG